MRTVKKLYIFTGKGGVGKTLVSMSFAKYLHSLGRKVSYICFEQNPDIELLEKESIPHIILNLKESTHVYIARKLGSEIAATWIMKTPFFKSLFNMVPGLSHIVILGHIISMLQEDPEMTIVLDSPSSGHAMTMFESSFNFKEMFKSGIIVNDIHTMQEFINLPNSMDVHILALPHFLAINEALELKEFLSKLEIKTGDISLNCSMGRLKNYPNLEQVVPPFLYTKHQQEEDLINQLGDQIKTVIPLIYSSDREVIIEQLYPTMEKLV